MKLPITLLLSVLLTSCEVSADQKSPRKLKKDSKTNKANKAKKAKKGSPMKQNDEQMMDQISQPDPIMEIEPEPEPEPESMPEEVRI